MPNLLDYVQSLGQNTFSDLPFSAPDSLVLTQIVYLPMETLQGQSVTVSGLYTHLAQTYPDGFTDTYQKKRYRLIQACAESDRFASIQITDYINHIDPHQETQFCAATFHLPDGGRYVAFRGTDLTIAGWKEDLNMSFMRVPAQREAVCYVEKTAAAYHGPLLLGGHSKGGHLALFAAAHVPAAVQNRLIRAYSFDGPGVDEDTLSSEAYEHIKARVESYIPQSSVVGMLLCYHPVYQVVRSNTIGLLQHDAMTWQIKNGSFETLPGLDVSAHVTDEALRQWIDHLSLEDRRKLTDTVFYIVSALDSDTVDPLMQDFPASSRKLFNAFRKLDPETRAHTRRIIGDLFSSGASEAAHLLLPATMRNTSAITQPATQLAEHLKERQAHVKEKQEEIRERLREKIPKLIKNDGDLPS